jgi:hypothetical protein
VAGLAAEARFELRAQRQKTKAGSDPGLFVLRVVIVREGGRSSMPRLLDLIADLCDYWMPAFAGMTGRVRSRPFSIRHRERSEAIHRCEALWIASSPRSSQ